MDNWNVHVLWYHWSDIPICSLPSQYVVNLCLYSSNSLRCRACMFLNILHQNHQQLRWNWFGDCCVSIVLVIWLRSVIHKVSCVGQGNNVQFFLPVGVHKFTWLPVEICIHCAPCSWNCMQLWILLESWISRSLYTLLYSWKYLGKNIWCACTCIAILYRRWSWLHAVSLWLNLMWRCWVILDNIWYSISQRVLFCEFMNFVVWCHILLSNRLLFYILVCLCGGWTLLCQFPHVFSIPMTRGPFHCIFILPQWFIHF